MPSMALKVLQSALFFVSLSCCPRDGSNPLFSAEFNSSSKTRAHKLGVRVRSESPLFEAIVAGSWAAKNGGSSFFLSWVVIRGINGKDLNLLFDVFLAAKWQFFLDRLFGSCSGIYGLAGGLCVMWKSHQLPNESCEVVSKGVRCAHVFRELNQVADRLAILGLGSRLSAWNEDKELRVLVRKDALGCRYNRL